MKKLSFLIFALLMLIFTSCEEDLLVSNLEVSYEISNKTCVFVFTAKADNAESYIWYANNIEIARGETMEYNFCEIKDRFVICAAEGNSNVIYDTTFINVEIDSIYLSEVAEILCGYDKETDNNSATWYWGANKAKILSGGPKAFIYSHDSADFCLFDPIDQSLWYQDYLTINESYNDAYSFNTNLEYTCDYKENGFCLNWAYAYHRYNINSTIYEDEITHNLPQKSKWTITEYDYDNYSDYDKINEAPKTIVNGNAVNKAYYLQIWDGAYLMQECAEPKYQILRIDKDTVFLRWEVGLPEDFDTSPNAGWIYPDWIDYDYLEPGVGQWMYGYLVEQESKPLIK